MALIADIDNIDLVVEPSELTADVADEFRQAIRERRQTTDNSQLADKALELLKRRRSGPVTDAATAT